MEVRIFTHTVLHQNCPPEKLSELKSLFKSYKLGLSQPVEFGRDEPYDRPHSVRSADLRHIHIKDNSSKNWHLQRLSLYQKTSDTALVYCRGAIQTNCYLLLDILENAHSYYRGSQFHLIRLAEIAEDFRSKF